MPSFEVQDVLERGFRQSQGFHPSHPAHQSMTGVGVTHQGTGHFEKLALTAERLAAGSHP